MPQLSQRVQLFTDSVIRRMTRISEQYGAINLSQGYPDFDPPKPMLDRLAQVAYEGPQPRGAGHLRRHRGYDVRHDDRVQPRGQGHCVQPLL